MKPEVKINYYNTFKCIADQCPLTCCQEWRIAVDKQTEGKWKGKTLSEENGNVSLCSCLEKEEQGKIIRLNSDKKCPFLNQEKLCKLVIELGEEYLSKTCTTFPRQVNKFEEHTEHTLASCCPVVVDLMRDEEPVFEGVLDQNQPIFKIREQMRSIIKEESHHLPQRMLVVFYMLLGLMEQEQLTVEKVEATGSSKQLEPLVEAMKGMQFSKIDALLESNELFLDVVENYRKQGLYVNYLESIATLAEQIEQQYQEEEILRIYDRFEEALIPYERVLKHYVLAEIYSNSLMPDSELEDMVIAFQWIALEYTVIRQALFLKWLEQGEGELAYETVRDYITVIARVTGYDASDIYEYLENSFEEVIWEWGYMAMFLGNDRF